MTWNLVQEKYWPWIGAGGLPSSNTLTGSFPSDVGNGNLLLAFCQWDNGGGWTGPSSASDTIGNIWQRARRLKGTSNAQWGEVWYTVVTGPGGCTFSLNLTQAELYKSVLVQEFSGNLQTLATVLDATGSTDFTAATTSFTTRIATVTDGDLVVGFLYGSNPGYTAGSQYTLSSADTLQQVEYGIQSTANASTIVDFTASAATTDGMIAAAFQPAPAAPGNDISFPAIMGLQGRKYIIQTRPSFPNKSQFLFKSS